MNDKEMINEIQTNPLLKLQMADKSILDTLAKNPDPKLAETLMEKKLKTIGLDEREIAVVFLHDGYKYPLQKAMSETGLSSAQLDTYYDSAVSKINAFLQGNNGSVLGNLKSIFGSNTNNGDLHNT